MMEAIGRALALNEVVHHRNENKTDNRLGNLQLKPLTCTRSTTPTCAAGTRWGGFCERSQGRRPGRVAGGSARSRVSVLKLADNLKLPIHLVTESVGILAKRRAGKSTTARRLAEQLEKAKQQVVVADPKGDWWGLLFARDGTSPGLPFVVLGGEHGHIPLEVGAGELVAKMVVTERVSLVLDLSQFRKHEVSTFMTAFMENLYRLKAQEQYRTPMMLIIDEADAIAPQKPQRGEELMLGAVEDLVRRGGQRGIGVTMITQRSAVLNKNVLTQIGILIVLRTIAPQDIKAMKAWIDLHGTEEQAAALIGSLPALPTGTGWVWAPGWPDKDGIFEEVDFLVPETFDSSKTPGQSKTIVPKNAADVDLAAFQREMKATIEKAKADDPRELRKQVAELQRQLKTLTATENLSGHGREKVIEKPVLKDGQLERAERLVTRAVDAIIAYHDRLQKTIETADVKADKPLTELRAIVDSITAAIEKTRQPTPPIRNIGPTDKPYRVARTVRPAPRAVTSTDNGHLTPAKQKILNGLTFLHGIGVALADKTQLALLIGVSPTSGGYFNNLGSLRSDGLIDYPSAGTVALTAAGQALASTDGVPSTTQELHAAIMTRVSPAKWRILDALIRIYPDAISKDALAEQIDASPTSGGYFNNLGSLRSLGLIDYPSPGAVAALPVLFLE